ncbi:MAG: 1,2-phenylacetyl-CoA epoxidase subunit PaaC [Bacteroidia bacterium]
MEKNNLYKYIIRLADNALILGQRLSENCSKGPFLEEDLAQTNIALDYIGRAQALFNYAAKLNNNNQTEDDLAYRRDEIDYLNFLLVEQANQDFAYIIARQFYYSAFDCLLYNELTKSKDETLASIAKKSIKESNYHLTHTIDWVIRLGNGTDESKHRLQNAIDALWTYTGEMFEQDEIDLNLSKNNIAPNALDFKANWLNTISTTLKNATLKLPENSFMMFGGRNGKHTENLGHILSEMQYLQRAYPNATW